ncbi:MAG TPA: carboxypeptidase regulatory-like domain-containing protein [Acidobacteriaceae bacterium]|jgi:tetratricopeptide (TPR) repeat protein|nr:carboxypeptidase regulatory-like domain-containing protein [Acidobacteriaceae bacterium]
MNKTYFLPRLALAALLVALLPLAMFQAHAQTGAAGSGKIHGQVLNPTGAPMTSGNVSLYLGGMTSPNQEAKYTLPVDANGNFKGDDVAAGTYTIVFRQLDTPKDKVVDQIDGVKITAGQDTDQNIDMSRPEYLAKLTPEQRKALEETKEKNAGILKENAQIKNLNADLNEARQDRASKNYAAAETLMQKDVAIKPEEPLLWVELGQAQLELKQYPDAETSLTKAITLEQAAKKPNTDVEGAAGNALGEVLADENKIPESQAAYDAAAKADPAQAGMFYQNEAIVMSRTGQTDATVAAADKAIAADPTRPIPYYLKGQALINKATVDPKTKKIIAPPGTQEAYQKYLDLAPNGPFSNDAKSVLAELGQTQSTSYKAGKKH